MKSLSFISALAIAITTGCASHGTVQTDYDKFTNTTINRTGGVYLPRQLGENFQVVLNLCQKVPPHGKPYYYLVLNSVALLPGEPDAHLNPNQFKTSLYVLADNRRLSYSWDDYQQHRFWFPIPKDQARVIAGASTVEIRVVRPDGSFWERQLAAQNIATFHQFAAHFLEDDSSAASATP